MSQIETINTSSSNNQVLKITKRKKQYSYVGKHLTQLFNEKYNWCSPHTHNVMSKKNHSLYTILTSLMKKPENEIRGYDLLLLLQEAKEKDEVLCLNIFKHIKKILYQVDDLFNYIFHIDYKY